MAEIAQDGGGKKGGKGRSKKMSTRIDFTPMVDLGFLLITFFMLTTTLAKPKTMEINMPEKDDVVDSTKVKASTALTLILTENDRIFYYFGIGGEDGTPPEVLSTTFSSTKGIRKILLEGNDRQIQRIKEEKKKLESKAINDSIYKQHVKEIKGDKDALMVMIKSDDKAKYKNLIDILDEMQITNVGKYAIVDITPQELEMIGGVANPAATTPQ